MYYLAVGAMFKNEEHILEEWLDHHIIHGVEHFYLINDASTDFSELILQPYISKGLVTLIQNDIPRDIVNRQCLTYEKFKMYSRDAYWLAVLDLDEFLYSPTIINCKDVLKHYEEFSAIEIMLFWFGNNGNLQQPTSVIASCTKRGHTSRFYIKIVKSIVKLQQVNSFGVNNHSVNGKIKVISIENFDVDGLQEEFPLCINHYYCQSKDYFLTRKYQKGDANNISSHLDTAYWESIFNRYETELNELNDDRLYKQNNIL